MQTFTVKGQYVVNVEYQIRASDIDSAYRIVKGDCGMTAELHTSNDTQFRGNDVEGVVDWDFDTDNFVITE